MIDWQPRAAALADDLVARHTLTDPAWRDAFARVPRHVFVPRFWQIDEDGRAIVEVDSAVPADHATWTDTVYRDQVLVTMHSGDPDRTPTSSSSQPSAIALMLEELDPRPGDRVLEIGTGTGYNAALLCVRVGDRAVTSIDIDANLVQVANDRLAAVGYHPLLVAGDGFSGVAYATPDRPASGPPYDRIIATCATSGIPPAWIAQLALGGRVVAPMTFGGALAVLTKSDLGAATGSFSTHAVGFMPLHPRGRAIPDGYALPVPEAPAEPPATETTELGEAELSDPNFALWLRLHMPSSRTMWQRDDVSGTRTGVIVYTSTRRATVTFRAGATLVAQGPDRLFDEVVAAWRAWQANGAPARDRFGMTATVAGEQYVWLGSPDGPRWPVPT